jgi:hypothetical protein
VGTLLVRVYELATTVCAKAFLTSVRVTVQAPFHTKNTIHFARSRVQINSPFHTKNAIHAVQYGKELLPDCGGYLFCVALLQRSCSLPPPSIPSTCFISPCPCNTCAGCPKSPEKTHIYICVCVCVCVSSIVSSFVHTFFPAMFAVLLSAIPFFPVLVELAAESESGASLHGNRKCSQAGCPLVSSDLGESAVEGGYT